MNSRKLMRFYKKYLLGLCFIFCLAPQLPIQAGWGSSLWNGIKTTCNYPAFVGTACWQALAQRWQPTPVQKLPIVYDARYNFSVAGLNWLLQYLHQFDLRKYGKVASHLQQTCGVSGQHMYKPGQATGEAARISDADLQLVHTPAYLNNLNTNSIAIAHAAEIPELRYVPSFLLRYFVLSRMRSAVQGTCDAVRLALDRGWAINLGGGYHHAKAGSGEGFCVYNDVAIAIKKLWLLHPEKKVLIVDLDAHHGNGNAAIFQEEIRKGLAGKVAIFDMYSWPNYPQKDADVYNFEYDQQHASEIPPCTRFPGFGMYNVTCAIPVDSKSLSGYGLQRLHGGSTDHEYFEKLSSQLPCLIDVYKPDLIIYNGGSDPHEDDLVGRLSLTADAIKDRDAFLFQQAKDRHIPLAMVLSGGYGPESHRIVGNSIEHVLKNVLQVVPVAQ